MKIEQTDFWWDDTSWATEISLPDWADFQSRRGTYSARDSGHPADGRVELVFAPEARDEGPLSEGELFLVQWYLDHHHAVHQALLDGLLAEYPQLQDRFRDALGDEARTSMPDVAEVGGFETLVGLSGVYVHQVEFGGLPYVGFELGCTWDAEHALGILMHGTRIVRIGAADTAFLLWMAEQDAESRR